MSCFAHANCGATSRGSSTAPSGCHPRNGTESCSLHSFGAETGSRDLVERGREQAPSGAQTLRLSARSRIYRRTDGTATPARYTVMPTSPSPPRAAKVLHTSPSALSGLQSVQCTDCCVEKGRYLHTNGRGIQCLSERFSKCVQSRTPVRAGSSRAAPGVGGRSRGGSVSS